MSVVDIKIGRPVGVKFSEKYVVSVKFMHGDADFFETKEVVFPTNKKERLLEFLNWLPYAEHCDGANDCHNYNKFADAFEYEDECEEQGIEFEFYGFDNGWPIDCNTSVTGSLCDISISYFDANGAEFSVSQIHT